MKQAARLKGHKKINGKTLLIYDTRPQVVQAILNRLKADNLFLSAKKAAKKDNFEHAAGHLVLAIGGDLNK